MSTPTKDEKSEVERGARTKDGHLICPKCHQPNLDIAAWSPDEGEYAYHNRCKPSKIRKHESEGQHNNHTPTQEVIMNAVAKSEKIVKAGTRKAKSEPRKLKTSEKKSADARRGAMVADKPTHRGRPLKLAAMADVEKKLAKTEPGAIYTYSVKVNGVEYPIRQVGALLTGFEPGTFGTWDAYLWCKWAGFTVKGEVTDAVKGFLAANKR